MNTNEIIGSDEWKKHILGDLKNIEKLLMSLSKDMSSHKVYTIHEELTTYFKQDERKN